MFRLHAQRVAVAVAVIIALAGFAGCRSASRAPAVSFSGKVNREGSVTVPTAAADRPVLVEIDLRDYAFKPTILDVTEGSGFVLRLRNRGSVPHSFTIPSLPVDLEIKPGEVRDVRLHDFGAGQIPFRCRFHVTRGMQGGFLVRAARNR